jgi:branched-chain amino acid transport system permease protein
MRRGASLATLGWAAGFGAAALAAAFLPGLRLLIAETAIAALFAVSLGLVLAVAGIVSLGHAAFFGIGAYAAGLTALHLTPDPLAGLAVAAGCAAMAGAVSALPLVRGNDLTRLVLTLAVAMLLLEGANRFAGITGGSDGLQGIAIGPVLGAFDFDLGGRTAAFYCLAVLAILFLAARRLVASPFGLSLRAIRDEPVRARALGVPVGRRIVGVYTIAAGMAGVAGALNAQSAQFVSLDVLEFHRSAEALLAVAVGAAAGLGGALAGAVLLEVAQERFSSLTPQYWQFWLGLLLIAVVFLPRPAWPRGGAAERDEVP